MKYLLTVLFILTLFIANGQKSNLEVGFFAAGTYKNKSRFNSKKVLYLSPEITWKIKNNQIGIGFSYESENARYNKNYVNYINQKNEYLSRTTNEIGLKIIGRKLVPLASERWKLIVGLNIFGIQTTGSTFQIDLDNSYKEIKSYSAGLRHYGGIKYQPNEKWSFNAYIDLFRFSYDIEQKPSNYKSTTIGPDLDITKGFEFIKLGFAYNF